MTRFVISLAIALAMITSAQAQDYLEAARGLVKRVVPAYARYFRVESLTASDSTDVFEIESRAGQIVVRGNNGVAIASGFYYYLKEVAGGQVTWNGTNINLQLPLPEVKVKIRKQSPYTYRYYLNYCTFNYSMSWWDWARWEQEIDWMALHGINMPLAITGQEYVWYEVYRELGFSDAELEEFFSGPAYFAWFWMGNLDGWGGPLPKSWFKSHRDLQQKILKRQRELGMKPVLPAFTGHVPRAFARRFPNAKLKSTNWTNGFADTYILDSEDPMFQTIGKKFIEKQTRLYGTDHLYSADTFNENEPPSDDPEYLSALSKRVFEGMRAADPDATWVMQGWLFYSDRKFWHAPQIKALLDAVPDDRMILLDLAAEIEPVWKRTEAFYGKPWIWNMLHNFGGNISMFGRIDGVATGPALAAKDTASGKMVGIGLTMEAIEQNPVLYELMTDHTWRDGPIEIETWLRSYLKQRYGVDNEHAIQAWEVLRSTVYNGKAIRDGAESIIVARPTFEKERRWAKTTLNYEPQDLLPAWDKMVLAATACGQSDGFAYDLVDVSRQVLANYALTVHAEVASAYRERDVQEFQQASQRFLTLMDDLDLLLASRTDFMLGPWIQDARRCGKTESEKSIYERNARNLITLWGDKDNRLHEYSNRQWSGLIRDFYKVRWEKFFREVQQSFSSSGPFDQAAFDRECKEWEWQWVNQHKDYPVAGSGNGVTIATRLHSKYRETLTKAYSR